VRDARARLCDFTSTIFFEPTDDEMVRMHFEGCDECRHLAAILARLATDLPVLAELEPTRASFTGVLARTSERATPSLFDGASRSRRRRLAQSS